MKRKLLIAVLGTTGAGKTTTWEELFHRKVRTGKYERQLKVYDKQLSAFLINGSPLERRSQLEDLMPADYDPDIVLCSFLYHQNVTENFDYFINKGYNVYVQWLNPGFHDEHDECLFYNIGLINHLLACGACVSVKNAKNNPEKRVKDMLDYIYGYVNIDEESLSKDLEEVEK